MRFKVLIIALLSVLSLVFYGCSNNSNQLSTVPEKPTDSIYVQDYAKIMNPETKSQINSLGRSLNSKTKAQVVVVTVKSLNGITIEEYANQLFRKWGIGDKEKNSGVLLLVSANDRKTRIEVGYGLEGRITDSKAGNIIKDSITPFFKKNDFDRGILSGYKELIKEAGEEYNSVPVVQESVISSGGEVVQESSEDQKKESKIPLWIIILVVIIILILLIGLCSSGGRGSSGGGYSSGGSFFDGGDSFGGGDSGGGGCGD